MVETAGQQLFEVWRKQMEEGADAWARLLSQAPPSMPGDPFALWRPLVDTWAKTLAQTPMTPDLVTKWKQFADESIETWSRILGQVMNTESFAQMLGRTLDQWLLTMGPVKRAVEPAVENAVKALGLPSRAQVISVATQIVDLEDRIDRLEDGISALARRLDEIARMIERVGRAREAVEREAT